MDVMMPVAVMTPVVVVAPMPIVADAARAVVGQDHPAAAIRVIIGGIVIGVIGRAVEEAPVKMMVVREPITAVAKAAGTIAAAVEDRTGAKPAAMEYGAAAVGAATMEHRAAAVKTSAAMKAATTVEASAATAMPSTSAMSTADFSRQAAGSSFRRGGRARIDQRARLGALRDG